ncbi:flavodoxin [Desulfovibrio sp. SGI.169]|uniref:flavodoxin n=1 Tax=Desulfovibrio sp. SGI.169 TaxID=3420561 RepID=UPI003D063253
MKQPIVSARHFSRRNFLKYAVAGTLAAHAAAFANVTTAWSADAKGGNMLILYFSHSGNTRKVAEQIHGSIGGDMLELKTVVPYPQDYDSVVDQAQREQKNNARPRIATEIPNLEKYDVIFIGFPNWWGSMPMPFFTLLEKYDVGDRTIIPFCTHEGSRFGRSEQDLRRLCPRARLLKGFETRGSRAAGAQKSVDAWLRGLGLLTG